MAKLAGRGGDYVEFLLERKVGHETTRSEINAIFDQMNQELVAEYNNGIISSEVVYPQLYGILKLVSFIKVYMPLEPEILQANSSGE